MLDPADENMPQFMMAFVIAFLKWVTDSPIQDMTNANSSNHERQTIFNFVTVFLDFTGLPYHMVLYSVIIV